MMLVTGIILSLLIVFGSLLYGFHRRNSWGELMPQVLRETRRRVEQEMINLTTDARRLSDMVAWPIQAGLEAPEDFEAHTTRWLSLLEAFPSFRAVGLCLHKTGEGCVVARSGSGELVVSELRVDPDSGELDVWRTHSGDHAEGPGGVLVSRNTADRRDSPWYQRAVEARQPIATEVTLSTGEFGSAPTPGISRVAPIIRRDGALIGVAAVTVSLDSLSRIAQAIDVGRAGLVFALEKVAGSPWHVVSHPNTDLIAESMSVVGDRVEFTPAEEFGDARVRGFVEEFTRQAPLAPGASTPGFLFFARGVLYAGTATRADGSTDLQRVLCTVVPAMDIMGNVIRGLRVVGVILLACIAIAIALGVTMARRITQRLELVAAETRRIGLFHLEPKELPPMIIKEVSQLSQALEAMKTSLRNFRRYVPAELVRRLTQAGIEAELGGERRVMTIFFSDIAGFTGIAERLDPERLVALLAELNQAVTEEIQAAQGTIDKYIGDAVMAFWGAPHADPEHARHACLAALRCQSRLRALNERWRSEGLPQMRCRIGIATGELIVGNMGSQERLNYTVLGDPVNLASRIEGLNRHCDTGILVADSTFAEVRGQFVARPIDRVRVKGRETPLLVYEILGVAGEVDDSVIRLAADYAAALQSYFERDLQGAVVRLDALLANTPDDGPAQMLLKRCHGFMESPPPADWDGVTQVNQK
jgi:adenylate cyclase